MSNLVIVAIPDENDRVWKISSEKIPHLTLLFLGDVDKVAHSDQIVQFVEHAANTTLKRFYLPVDRRGELGADKADVLFFKKGRYDYKAIRDFRVQLLKDNNIRTAYDGATQFEGPWTPHLTLGYPTAPAKPDETDRDFGFYDVAFNRIAVWMGDFEGPEFLLKDYWDEFDALETVPMDVAMSDIHELNLEEVLQHYGTKGMKWGVRNDKGGDNTSGVGEKKGPVGSAKAWFDPTGHALSSDIIKGFIWPIIPVLGTVAATPSQVRLIRGAARGVKAKGVHNQEQKFTKHAQSAKNFSAIHNGAAERINRQLEATNKKYSEADLKIPAKKKAYDAEVLKAMQDSYKESANSLTNKAATMHLDVSFHGSDGMDVKIQAKEGAPTPMLDRAKHAAFDDATNTATFSAKLLRNKTGHIVGLDFEDFKADMPDSLAQMAIEEGAEFLVHMGMMTPDYFLEHYGVKGMQWGVRKPPPDAVGTSATSRVPQGNRRKTKIDVAGGQNHPAHEDALAVAESRAKLKKSGVAALSNADLQKMAKRLQLETQVAQLTSSRGQKFIRRQLEQQGQQTIQRNLSVATGKKIAKKAGKAAATGAVTVALL